MEFLDKYFDKNHYPTFENQIEEAKKLSEKDLYRHAMVGKTCGCRNCFTCACFETWKVNK